MRAEVRMTLATAVKSMTLAAAVVDVASAVTSVNVAEAVIVMDLSVYDWDVHFVDSLIRKWLI